MFHVRALAQVQAFQAGVEFLLGIIKSGIELLFKCIYSAIELLFQCIYSAIKFLFQCIYFAVEFQFQRIYFHIKGPYPGVDSLRHQLDLSQQIALQRRQFAMHNDCRPQHITQGCRMSFRLLRGHAGRGEAFGVIEGVELDGHMHGRS